MSQPTEHEVVEMMIRFGGNFARLLGQAFRAGDPTNQARIRAAFPEIFTQYTELATLSQKVVR